MTPVKPKQPLSTVSGQFHVGMTAQQAKEKDLYKSVFSRDFTDIDTDGNGVLSAAEICNERDRECKIEKGIARAGGVAGAILVGGGMATSATGIGCLAIGAGGAVAGTAAIHLTNMENEQEKTEQYRKQHPKEFGL